MVEQLLKVTSEYEERFGGVNTYRDSLSDVGC